MQEILVVEDDEKCARVMVSTLRRIFGVATRVTVTDSAPKAIGLLQHGVQFRFIISDFDLADSTSGHEVLTYIRTEKPELVERFLFASGNDDIINWGAHYLLKPFSIDDLRAKLAEMNANK